ncbi:hypothetical protein SDC9_162097 [bioreactor metagenome]|uniref:Uncharacterized protein n=1 Tax=bioreactor metagenome TaxID=1076179 RepID=A0A645FK45_9ZZZZ
MSRVALPLCTNAIKLLLFPDSDVIVMLAVFVKSIEVELFVYGTPLIEIVAFGDTVIVGFSEVSETPSGTER